LPTVGARHPDHRLADHASGAAWLDAGLQVLVDTPLTDLEQVSVTLLVTGQARWVGIVQKVAAGPGSARPAARPHPA